ncbi:MAG: transposase [Actinomycetes bacterium]
MKRKVNQVLWDQWRQRMERQRTCGLSIVAFCREEGVSQASFHAWKRKLHGSTSTRHSSEVAATTRHPRKRRASGRWCCGLQDSAASTAAPMRAADFLQLPVRTVRSSPWIELSLVDGTLVRIPQENLAALTTLLRVLRGGSVDTFSGEVRHA